MKSKNSFGKWVWLVLIMAFAAIAGGGCNGSSSGGGGDGVTNVGKTEHPLLDYLREHADPETLQKIKDRIHVVGNTMTVEELDAAMPDIQKEFEAGKIIGMFGPRQELIDALRAGLGVNVVAVGPAADGQQSEFYMITKRNMVVFDNKIHYVAGSGDGSLLAGLRTKADHYPEFAAKIAGWHDRVTELAKEVSADSTSAFKELSAAAAVPPRITDYGIPFIRTWHTQFEDAPSGHDGHPYKFPMIDLTVKMWSCYSFADDKNVYLVKTSGTMNPESNYEWWKDGREYQINFTALYKSWAEMKGISGDKGKLWLADHLPHNLNKATNYTQSFSWSAGINGGISGNLTQTGTIGGGFTAGVETGGFFQVQGQPSATGGINIGGNFGLTYSDSKTWTVYDYEIKDSTSGNVPSVNYEFSYNDPENEQRLPEPSNIAKSNFTSDESWIWVVDRASDPYTFDHHVRYESRFLTSTGTFGAIGRHNGEAKSFGRETSTPITLPIPPSFVTPGNLLIVNGDGYVTPDTAVKVSVASSGPWEVSSDVAWVELGEKSGDKTLTSMKEFVVSIKPNPDPNIRKGNITFVGPNDPKGKPQTAVIEIQQGGKK